MSAPIPNPPRDVRPGIWLGHVTIAADEIGPTADFYLDLGMRQIHTNENVSVLEMAGGTHLVIILRDGAEGVGLAPSVDLMVRDVDAARAALLRYEPTEITDGTIHRTFEMHDPAGNHVAIHDSHIVGAV